jgi:Tol biopolymer transport system component
MKRSMLFVVVLTLSVVAGVAKADFTFGEPINLGPQVNSSARDINPRLTGDSLELYFMTERASDMGYGGIWLAKRATTNDPWGEPEPIDLPNASTGSYWAPDISADGLSLFLTSAQRPDERYGASDIYVATRLTKTDPWSLPVNLGPIINTSLSEACPYISANGLSLWFSGDPWPTPIGQRSNGYGMADIWISTYQTSERNPVGNWSEPQNLGPVVNSSSMDASPFVTDDGRVLLFHSDRSGGYADLWMARRDSRDNEWGTPVNLGSTVNSAYEDAAPEISPDGSVLLFTSDRPSGQGLQDLWQAPIIPIVDLNSDRIVDSADMVIMVDSWGTDNSLCDIGPMPWGDGVVDVEDLKVLAEHLFEEVPVQPRR